MASKRRGARLFLGIAVLLSLTPGLGTCESRGGVRAEKQGLEASDGKRSPEDEREARLAKDKRYNGGGCDLTKTVDCFFEVVEPGGLPPVPVDSSALVFVGKVVGIHAYLSEDRTHIYTETDFHVEELLKKPRTIEPPPDKLLAVDRVGGTIRTQSGQVLRDETKSGVVGEPAVGRRYLVFATSVHGGRDLMIAQVYELRDGKVFRLPEHGADSLVVLSRTSGREDELSHEDSLVRFIRERARSAHNPAR